jgi:hypothetical protein
MLGKTTINKLMTVPLQTLNAVMADLSAGIEEERLYKRYRGKRVIPGVCIREYVSELRSGGCIRLVGGKIVLRS